MCLSNKKTKILHLGSDLNEIINNTVLNNNKQDNLLI